MIKWYILLAALLCFGSSNAQRTKKVKVEYEYYSSDENESPAHAKQTALYKAQLQAIADHYGSIVSETSQTKLYYSLGEESERFFSYGESDVRGEWIETIGKPEYEVTYIQDMLVVKVTVEGRIRELQASPIQVDYALLFNGTDKDTDLLRNSTFKFGDKMYLYFKSPIDGWLAFYNVDEDEDMTVQSLLPYPEQTSGAYQIKANQEYVFFSKEKAAPMEDVREIVMRSRDEHDFNLFYLIFSPNHFVKAIDEHSTNIGGYESMNLPRQLNFDDFQKWLGKCRRHDKDMIVKRDLVEIVKPIGIH